MTTLDLQPHEPWPGGYEAIKRGCVCPSLDNQQRSSRGDKGAFVDDACPLHGVQPIHDDFIHRPWPERRLA